MGGRIDSFALPANADLHASEYCGAQTTNGNASVGNTGQCIGVLISNPFMATAAGQAQSIAKRGQVCKVRSGAAFAIDALLDMDATGKFITHNADTVNARALEAATAADQFVLVYLY